jgi:hypothetical protein
MNTRDQVKMMIASIESAGKSLYYIAKVMGKQHVQIQRMKKSGRCEKDDYDELVKIFRENVPQETLQT